MNTSPGEYTELTGRVRHSLDRLTDGARLSEGAAPLIRHRVRQTRRNRYAALAGGTAAIAAVAILTATGGTTISPQPTSGQLSVISHVTRALAARVNDVVHTVSGGAPGWQADGWFSRDASRMLLPGREIGMHRSGSVYIAEFVTYGNKTALLDTEKHPQSGLSLIAEMGLNGPGESLAGCPRTRVSPFADTNWSAYLGSLLSCGGFKVTGHAHVGGTAVVVLTKSAAPPIGTVTLDVNARTYLPVRLNPTAGPPSMSFQWLPPTAANLAHLTIPIPAGYKIVRVSN